ncbi:MAG: zinc ribbon domain-containing protein [Candidatus Bathyarchaeota archaeon]|nr:zinc ribbon domain-containing protein [Candidatus Bathyarchaeota archaeon]
MPYCPKCGKEHEKAARYCPSCGADLLGPVEPTYRRRRDPGWTLAAGLGRGVAAFIAFILLMAGLGLAVGGFAVLSVHSNFVDSDGFIMSYPAEFTVDSYAVVQKAVNINIDTDLPIWIPDLGDFVQLKIVATNNDPSKDVFIGIAGVSEASGYMSGTNYHEVDDFSWNYNPWRETPPVIVYNERSGGAPAVPLIHSFWSAHLSGSGTQTLTWEPLLGNFWIVGMNADGSMGVDIEVRMGVRLPILRTIGGILLVVGLMLVLIALSLFRGVL